MFAQLSPVLCLESPAMPKPKDEVIKQTNLRLKESTLRRMREYANSHRLQPTLTQIVEAALAQFFADGANMEPRPSSPRRRK